jgi:DNA repair protein RadC
MRLDIIKEMPIHERPRERLVEVGAKNLLDYELLAILLGTGIKQLGVIDVAKQLLHDIGGLSKLGDLSVEELASNRGIGDAKAVILLASIELGKRSLSQWRETVRIASAWDVYQLLQHDARNLKQEVLWGLYLDTKSHLISKKEIFMGGLNQSMVHPREIFKYAVKCSAFQIVLVHNHPSGDPAPSFQDIEMTERMVRAGEMMSIPVVDHVIIAQEKYASVFAYMKKKSRG